MEEEVTLADLVDTLRRHKRVAYGVFAVVMVLALGITYLGAPTYESEATVLPSQQRPALVAILDSADFHQGLPSFQASNLQPDSEGVVVITVQARSAQAAQEGAQAVLDALANERPALDEATRAANWQRYFEQAGKNATRAQAQLDELTEGMQYYQVTQQPTMPAEPSSPNARLNVALGVVLGLMLAVFSAFAWAWYLGYRDR